MNAEISVCTLSLWSTVIATQATPNLMANSWVHPHQRGEAQVLPNMKQWN